MNDPFAALYPASMMKQKEAAIAAAAAGKGETKGKKIQILRNLSHRSKKPKKGQGNSDSSEEEEGDEKEKGEDAGSEDISENAEEDIKAQVLLSKEEAENALFKRLFQNKIK